MPEEREEAVRVLSEAEGAGLLGRPPRAAPASERVEGVPGAVLVRGVLRAGECAKLRAMADAVGFAAETPTRRPEVRERYQGHFGRLRAPRSVWLATDSLCEALFWRLRRHVPQSSLGGGVCGLNRRWRVYRYERGHRFLPHLDDAYEASIVDAGGGVATDPSRRSLLTVLVYLTGGLAGGETRFWLPDRGLESFRHVSVEPVAGDALLFFHGSHPLSLIHEGCPVERGVKYVLRGDVLYDRGAAPDEACEDFRLRARRWPQLYAARLKWERLGRGPPAAGQGGSPAAGGETLAFLERVLGASALDGMRGAEGSCA